MGESKIEQQVTLTEAQKKYFTVEEVSVIGSPKQIEVKSDGTWTDDECSLEKSMATINIGYIVSEYDETGDCLAQRSYPVKTDVLTMTDNSVEVLERIRADYPASEWQNNAW